MTAPHFSSGRRLLAAAVAVLCLSTPAWPWQTQDPVSGRTIAPVMGMGGADWLERPERESEEAPDEALDAIGLHKGMTIADVGAGIGYVTMKLARRVGPGGTVYATDIQPAMLTRLRAQAERENLSNIRTVLGTETDPKLPADKLDLILMVDVYHELSHPQKMLDAMRAALRPDGRLVLLEYRKEDPSIPIRELHKMSVAGAKLEVEAEGYRLDRTIEILPRQHILVFRKK
ncbi:MAG: class I SAM-dependent methyltransferase [Bryobacteraceae bacterium]